MSDHQIEWTHCNDHVEAAATCQAQPGSDCRVYCDQGCESYSIERDERGPFHTVATLDDLQHRHDLVPYDGCVVIDWLNAEPDVIPEMRVGSTDEVPIGCIAIKPVWEGDYYAWEVADRERCGRDAYETGRRDALTEAAALAWNEANRATLAQGDHDPGSHAASRCVGGASAAYVIHDAVRSLLATKETDDMADRLPPKRLTDERLETIREWNVTSQANGATALHEVIGALFSHIDAQQERIDALEAERAEMTEEVAPACKDDTGLYVFQGHEPYREPAGFAVNVRRLVTPWLPVQEDD